MVRSAQLAEPIRSSVMLWTCRTVQCEPMSECNLSDWIFALSFEFAQLHRNQRELDLAII